MPNGVRADKWTPGGSETRPELSPTWKPLEKYKDDILVLSGLSNKASFTGDGHYVQTVRLRSRLPRRRARTSMPTECPLTRLLPVRSVDIKPPSLELGTQLTASGIDTNVNYTRIYASQHRVESTHLFRCRVRSTRGLLLTGYSVPDQRQIRNVPVKKNQCSRSAREDAKRLQRELGTTDQQKLEEYLESVREVERRIEHEANELQAGTNLSSEVAQRIKEIDKRISEKMGKANREQELHSMPRFDHTDHVRRTNGHHGARVLVGHDTHFHLHVRQCCATATFPSSSTA